MISHFLDEALSRIKSLIDQEKFAQANALCEELLSCHHQHFLLFFYAGTLAALQQRWAAAESYLLSAHEHAPDNIDILNNLAVVYRRIGNTDKTLQTYQMILQLTKNHTEAIEFIADIYASRGQMTDAIALYKQLLALNPTNSKACNNLCVLLNRLGYSSPAVFYGKRAVQLESSSMSHHNLGLALNKAEHLQEALKELMHAYRLCSPEFSDKNSYNDLLNDIGAINYKLNNISESIKFFEKSFNFKNDISPASQILYQMRLTCDWINITKYNDYFLEYINSDFHCSDCFTSIMYGVSKHNFLRIAKNFSEEISKFTMEIDKNHQKYSKIRKKIRIGYLSYDFFEHATSYLIPRLFELHDRNNFEIFIYSYGYHPNSPTRNRIQQAADHFVDLHDMDNQAAAERIAGDELDILVDLKGYTSHARVEIMASRPCPIQVNYLGFPGTMGADFMDYIVADSFIIPEGHEAWYSEKIIYLPHCYQVNDDRREIAKPKSRSDYGLPEDAFVLCAFNAGYKITPQLLDIWVDILLSVPDSVLWLLTSESLDIRPNIIREVKARGLDPSRVIFAMQCPQSEHLARMQVADLFIDTYPVSGHTTASDSLWAGLPLVTIIGDSFASRVAGSLLHTIGLPELITSSFETYKEKILELSNNRQKLANIRADLAQNRLISPLFDTERFTRNLERAWKEIVENHHQAKPLASLFIQDEAIDRLDAKTGNTNLN